MMKHIGSGLKINMTHKRSCLRPSPIFLAPPPAPGSCLLIPILYLPNPFSSFMRRLLIARAHEPSFLSPSLHCINCWEPIRTHCNVKRPEKSHLRKPRPPRDKRPWGCQSLEGTPRAHGCTAFDWPYNPLPPIPSTCLPAGETEG